MYFIRDCRESTGTAFREQSTSFRLTLFFDSLLCPLG